MGMMARPKHPETVSCNASSPGPVQDREYLLRFVVSPYHLISGTKKKINPAALFKTEELTERGGSVDRLDHTCKEIIYKTAEDLSQKARNQCLGVLKGNCGEIRRITDSNQNQVFMVYDTAKPDWISHADIFSDHFKEINRSLKLKFRKKLFEIFGELVALNQIAI